MPTTRTTGSLPRAALYSPRERLIARSLSRPPVGYFAPHTPGRGDNPIAVERGITQPVTVTNVSQEIFPADAARKFITVTNNDPIGVVYVSFGGAGAGLNQGLRVGPGGGGFLLDINVPTSRIFMIGSIAANPNVSVVVA